MDDAADDGDALCKPEDMSPSVEYVRWSDVPLQSLDVSWTDTDYLKEQQAYKSGQDDTRTLQNKVQLSTYANHIGENLHDLHHFLTTRLQGTMPGFCQACSLNSKCFAGSGPQLPACWSWLTCMQLHVSASPSCRRSPHALAALGLRCPGAWQCLSWGSCGQALNRQLLLVIEASVC